MSVAIERRLLRTFLHLNFPTPELSKVAELPHLPPFGTITQSLFLHDGRNGTQIECDHGPRHAPGPGRKHGYDASCGSWS